MKNKINYKLVNFCIIMLITFFLYQTKSIYFDIFTYLKNIIAPFFIAFVIAYSLYPFVKILKSKGIRHNISCFLILLIIFLILLATIYFSIPLFKTQINNLVDIISDIDLNNINLQYRQYIISYLSKITNKIKDIICYNSFDIIATSFSIVSNSFVIIILSIYFLFNMEKIKVKLKMLIKNPKYQDIIRKIDIELEEYIKSFGIIILVESIEYVILYALIGHPDYLLIGILAGVTTIIPYFGAIITNIIALISAISISKKLFFLTSIITFLVPILDNYIRDPKIYHKTIDISPIKTIIIIIIFMYLFKFVGAIIAIPIYLIIKTIYQELKK